MCSGVGVCGSRWSLSSSRWNGEIGEKKIIVTATLSSTVPEPTVAAQSRRRERLFLASEKGVCQLAMEEDSGVLDDAPIGQHHASLTHAVAAAQSASPALLFLPQLSPTAASVALWLQATRALSFTTGS